MDRPLEPGTSWLGFDGDDERRPVRGLYGAFRRPRNGEDRRAAELARRTGALTGLGVQVAVPEGRLLLADELELVYAVPVADGRLFVAVLPGGPGGCGVPGPDGLMLLTSQLETGTLVFQGIVADGIESVDLIVDGVTHEAQMGENAFGLRLEHTHQAEAERIVLRRRDGTTNAIELRPEV